MALFNTCGFESGDEYEAFQSPMMAPSGTRSIQSSVTDSSAYALRVNPAGAAIGRYAVGGANNGGQTNLPAGDASNLYFRFRFRVDTLPASGSEEICTFLDATAAHKGFLRIDSSGNLQLYADDGT